MERLLFLLCMLVLADRFASYIYAEFLENVAVHFREHDCAVNLASLEFWELFECESAVIVCLREDRECNEDFVCVKARVATAEILNLSLLDRFDERLWNEFEVVVDACEMLHDIEEKCCRASEEWT